MDLSTEELFILNARRGNTQLPAGLAIQALGQPAVPPLPTTVTVDTEEDVKAFCEAYDIPLSALQQVWA